MYSSTTLNGPAESGCWKMLDYAQANADSLFPLEYRSYLGQAAHAVLQYCAEGRTETEAAIRKMAEEVGGLLIIAGREFRGRKEPPLPADDVWAGVDLAVQYILARGLPLDAEAVIPERDWEHPTLPFRALIDLVTVQDEGDEEYGQRVAEVTDYKSSWQADADELNTLQRWGQAVCVWRALNDPNKPHGLDSIDVIRQRVVNLRTWSEYTRDTSLHDEDDIAELEKWELRIEDLCDTASSWKTGERPTNPGVGCLSCAWRHVCDEVWPLENAASLNPHEAAEELAIVEGQRSMLLAMLKAGDPETPVTIPGGFVGYKEQIRRIMADGKEGDILDEWLERTACDVPDEDKPALVSLLSALKLGKGNLDALAKALMPERKKGIVQARDEYVESLTVENRRAQFGVWKDD